MSRISVRGFGLAAAVLTATSITGGVATAGAHLSADSPSVPALAGSRVASPVFAEIALAHSARANAQLSLRADALVRARRVAKAAAVARVHIAEAKAAARRRFERERAREIEAVIARIVANGGSNRALGLQLATQRGWGGQQFICLDQMWTHESNWNTHAQNASGAYGIPQAAPGNKMGSVGASWRNNPFVQIVWGLDYIARVYGNPCGAWSFWQQHQWY
jgi:hypothetical protein